MASTNPARGMRDFLPSDVRKRNYVIGIIKEVYESYGFEPLETPAVENIETLMGKYGEEGNQLIFKILKRGEKLREMLAANVEFGSPGDPRNQSTADLALRYDLTVPFARVVANRKNDLPKFFKRYQIQPVWRADRPARGRFREFYQCDVDAIGSQSMVVEVELISAVSEILTRLGFEDFMIRLNHRGLLTGILQESGIPETMHLDALVTIDKLDKISEKQATEELIQKGVPLEGVDNWLSFVNGMLTTRENQLGQQTISESNQEDINQLRKFLQGNDSGTKGLADLVDVLNLLEKKLDDPRVLIEPNLARGLSYYTGAIVEVVLTDGDFKGSIGGGGRYDGLIGMFGKEQIPACGFSLGLERILVVMDERNMFPPQIAASNSADVMVTIWNEDSIGESLKLANELRQQGLRVTVYPEADKIGKQLKYADTINVPFACILGDEEREQGKVQLKNMRSGEKFVMTVAEIPQLIKTS